RCNCGADENPTGCHAPTVLGLFEHAQMDEVDRGWTSRGGSDDRLRRDEVPQPRGLSEYEGLPVSEAQVGVGLGFAQPISGYLRSAYMRSATACILRRTMSAPALNTALS